MSSPPSTPSGHGYRGLAGNTDLDLRVGYDPARDNFWARIHDTTSGQVLLDRRGLADTGAVRRTVLGYGQVPGVVLSWLNRDRAQALQRSHDGEVLLIDL